MSILFLIAGFVGGLLTLDWSRTSGTFVAFCISQSVEFIQAKYRKLRGQK